MYIQAVKFMMASNIHVLVHESEVMNSPAYCCCHVMQAT